MPASPSGMLREHLGLHETGELPGDDHQERPPGEAADLAEADAPPAEVGAHVQTGAAPEEEQDAGLHDDAERRRAREQRDHLGRPVVVAPPVPNRADEDQEPGDRDEVVHDRRPRERAEHAARVERLADERVEAVEEDLRQAPVGERGGERLLIGREARARTAAPATARRSVARTAVPSSTTVPSVNSFETNAWPPSSWAAALTICGHDDGAQQAGRDDRVDVVRQLVGDRERVARLGRGADRRDEHDGAQEPAQARDDRPGADQHARASDAAHSRRSGSAASTVSACLGFGGIGPSPASAPVRRGACAARGCAARCGRRRAPAARR